LLFALVPALAGEGEHADHDDHAERDEHEKHEAHGEHEEHDDARQFTVADLARFGVTTATAAAGKVDVGLELPGEVRPNADRTAHLAPRFAGMVREVRKRVGDRVRAGETVAVIESGTLAPFTITAPFDGVVIDRHVTVGEAVAPERSIMIIADLDTVWVDIAVYQKDLALVRPGQSVVLSAGYGVADAVGTVSYLSPTLDQATRTATARVSLPNPDGRWRPGLFVTAVVEEPVMAAVMVERGALQRMDGQTVVFVARDGAFRPQPVTIGRLGRTKAEIVAGLSAGERYAAANSFLVKAELEKGAGGHDH
jgi:cobalt-zinc-cadmium efflux system membrane fusion protein